MSRADNTKSSNPTIVPPDAQSELNNLRKTIRTANLFTTLSSLPALSTQLIVPQNHYASEYPYMILLGTHKTNHNRVWLGLGAKPNRRNSPDAAPTMRLYIGNHANAPLKTFAYNAIDDLLLVEPFKHLWTLTPRKDWNRFDQVWFDNRKGMVKSLAYWYFVNWAAEMGEGCRVPRQIRGYLGDALRVLGMEGGEWGGVRGMRGVVDCGEKEEGERRIREDEVRKRGDGNGESCMDEVERCRTEKSESTDLRKRRDGLVTAKRSGFPSDHEGDQSQLGGPSEPTDATRTTARLPQNSQPYPQIAQENKKRKSPQIEANRTDNSPTDHASKRIVIEIDDEDEDAELDLKPQLPNGNWEPTFVSRLGDDEPRVIDRQEYMHTLQRGRPPTARHIAREPWRSLVADRERSNQDSAFGDVKFDFPLWDDNGDWHNHLTGQREREPHASAFTLNKSQQMNPTTRPPQISLPSHALLDEVYVAGLKKAIDQHTELNATYSGLQREEHELYTKYRSVLKKREDTQGALVSNKRVMSDIAERLSGGRTNGGVKMRGDDPANAIVIE